MRSDCPFTANFLITILIHSTHYFTPRLTSGILFFVLFLLVGKTTYGSETTTFILIENRSDYIAKLAAPGAKPVRVKPGETAFKLELDRENQNGVDAKAWWVKEPRQLCVIFVRYEGKVVIAGKKNIKCLGN